MGGLAGLVVPVCVIGGFFLFPYLTGKAHTLYGFDTPKYIWRANLVGARGLDALANIAMKQVHANPDRPGYPALASIFRATTGVDPFRLAYVLPAVTACVIGLAAGAFGTRALKDPAWSFPVYAIAMGVSVNLARTAIGYADNMLVDGVLVAAALILILAAYQETSILTAILLLCAAIMLHWLFAVTFLVVVLALTVWLLPTSFMAWRGGSPILSTPAARLGLAVGGAGLAGAATFGLFPSNPNRVPRPGPTVLARKYQLFISVYALPLTAAWSVLGAVALWFPKMRVRRAAWALSVIWAGTALAAIVAYRVLHIHVPAYRILGAALGIPLLMGGALAGAGRLVSRVHRGLGPVVAAVLVGAGLAGILVLSSRVWLNQRPGMSADQVRQVALAGRYLEQVGGDRPAIVVIGGASFVKEDHILRALMPPDRVLQPRLFVGRVEDLLAGHPTVPEDADRRLITASQQSFVDVRPILGQDPIILRLSAFGLRQTTVPGMGIAPGVDLIRGPEPTGPLPSPTGLVSLSATTLIGSAVAVFAVLTLAGLGWAWALVPGNRWERVALAPAFGVAMLAVTGVLADRLLGLRLLGGTGIGIAAFTALAGLGLVVVRGRLPSRAPTIESPAPDAVAEPASIDP